MTLGLCGMILSRPRHVGFLNSIRTAALRTRFPAIAATLCTLIVVWRYGPVVESWWWKDDATILLHAVAAPVLQNFSVPSVWRPLSVVNLTPWVCLIFDIDFRLFGFDPRGHYLHHLAMLVGCAVLLILLARTWVDRFHALAAGLLFIGGAPVAVVSMQLMTRHYVEGLFYLLLALILYQRALKSGKFVYAAFAACAFAVAVTAKELYVPLGLVPLLLPTGTWRQRLAAAWPILLIMAVYPLWRHYMLGDSVGGYAPAGSYLETPVIRIFQQFAEIPSVLIGNLRFLQAAMALIPFLAILLSPCLSRARLFLLLLTFSALLLGPLIPLAIFGGFQDPESQRFLFALWAATALLVAVSLGTLVQAKSSPWRVGSLTMLLTFGLAAASQGTAAISSLAPLREEYATQGRAIMASNPDDILLLTPAVANWYAQDVNQMRRRLRPGLAPPVLAADEAALANQISATRRVFRYEAGRKVLADITEQVPSILAAWRSRIRSQPLVVDVAYDPASRAMHASFGPDSAGAYRAMKSPAFVIDVPAQLHTRTGAAWSRSCFIIRHCTSEGFLIYSPPLAFSRTSEGTMEIHWRGEGADPVDAFRADCMRQGIRTRPE